MADDQVFVKAVFDLLDGNETSGYTVDGKPVIVPGVSGGNPSNADVYAEIAVKGGVGDPLEIGKPTSARYFGAVTGIIRGPLGLGYGLHQSVKNAMKQKFEGVSLTVDSNDRTLFRSMTEDFDGPVDHEYVVRVRVPFERTRSAPA